MAEELVMKYAGNLIQHLGLQMYAGAVPAILEIVSNAWDADAGHVEVRMPLDRPISETDEITVKDDGFGMSFDECNEKYLVIGRNRRNDEGRDTTPSGRDMLARKGIGKLAGFGVSRMMEVWTVKDGHLTAFQLDYDGITNGKEAVREYKPPILADRPVKPDDPVQEGTLIKLTHLQLRRAINGDRFINSMTRRFALFSDRFFVTVNDSPIERKELELDFRIPETGMISEDIPDFGSVHWWMGFTKLPIHEEENRGIVIYAKGKQAQSPFFFDLSKGVHGQLGMQYMTGEVHAKGVDGPVDLVATDRGSIRFEDPAAAPLLQWGRGKVEEALDKWTKDRVKKKIQRSRSATQFTSRISRLTKTEQAAINAAIEKIATVEAVSDEQFELMTGYLMEGYENKNFHVLIDKINAADEASTQAVMELVTEWDVLEAVQVANIVGGHLKIIDKFEEMIRAGVKEKPDMQDYIKVHPWLLNPSWYILAHEKTLDKVIADALKAKPEAGEDRLDFFCLADPENYVVVEVKRPGLTVGRKELTQIEDYVDALRRHSGKSNTPEVASRRIKGILIATSFTKDADEKRQRLAGDDINTLTWDELLRQARSLHASMFAVAKARAPEDPRVQELEAKDQAAAAQDSEAQSGNPSPES